MRYKTLVFSAFMIVAAACSTQEAIPVPDDVTVINPSDAIPNNIAAFSGRWEGTWHGQRSGTAMADQILIVERFHSPTSARVVVAGISHWGSTSGQGWSQRIDAEFVDGALRYTARGGEALVTYRMSSDGTLEGTFETAGGTNIGTFARPAQ